MPHRKLEKPLTTKEISFLENALKYWGFWAMNASDPHMLGLKEAVTYATATNRLLTFRTGNPFFTRSGEELKGEALEDAIVEVVHLMEDKKVAFLDLCDQIGFGVDDKGVPLYFDQHLMVMNICS